MTILVEKKCKACEGGVEPLSHAQAQELLGQCDGWTLAKDGQSIEKYFHFKNYYHTMAFVNAIAFVANRENHHPDLFVTYNSCRVIFTTHAIVGLSENDFICAAKIDVLEKL